MHTEKSRELLIRRLCPYHALCAHHLYMIYPFEYAVQRLFRQIVLLYPGKNRFRNVVLRQHKRFSVHIAHPLNMIASLTHAEIQKTCQHKIPADPFFMDHFRMMPFSQYAHLLCETQLCIDKAPAGIRMAYKRPSSAHPLHITLSDQSTVRLTCHRSGNSQPLTQFLLRRKLCPFRDLSVCDRL